MSSDAVAARALLEAEGFVVLKSKSYRQAQERQRVAEALRLSAERDAEQARTWARNCLDSERRMRDRCADLVAFAMSHGATLDDLAAFNRKLSDEAGS